jgi:hypothetical protein
MRCSPAKTKIKEMAQKLMKGKKEAGKGLYKLYKSKPEVVEKMGYTMQMGKDKSGMDSSHTFPMKQAYNMQMAPLGPMLNTHDEEGMPSNISSEEAIGQTGALGTLETQTDTEVIPGDQETNQRLSYEEAWNQNIIEPGFTKGLRDRYEDAGLTFEDYAGGREEQRKADPEGYELDLVTKTGVSGGPGVITINKPDETVTTTTQKFTPKISQVEGLSPVGQRKDIRRGRILSRNIGKLERKLRKAKDGSQKKAAIQRELDALVKQSEYRAQQQAQGKTGKQQFDIDAVPTAAQAAELPKAGGSGGTSATPTIDIAGITGSGKKSNEFGRFGYQAGSMLENINMPMLKFKGKKSTYKK